MVCRSCSIGRLGGELWTYWNMLMSEVAMQQLCAQTAVSTQLVSPICHRFVAAQVVEPSPLDARMACVPETG